MANHGTDPRTRMALLAERAFASAGVDRCLLTIQQRSADETLTTLDGWAALVSR
jgi:hypothetical protein